MCRPMVCSQAVRSEARAAMTFQPSEEVELTGEGLITAPAHFSCTSRPRVADLAAFMTSSVVWPGAMR